MATVIADGLPNGQGAPLKEQNLSSLKQQMTLKNLHNAKYFVIHRTEGATFSSVSPFLIQKGLSATVGSVKAVSKRRSGDLLVEVSTTKQAEQLLALQMVANIPSTVLLHANLNSSRGVISESDLYNAPEQEILEGYKIRKSVQSEESLFDVTYVALSDHTFPFQSGVYSARDLVIQKQLVVENPLVFVAGKWDTRDSGEYNGQEKCINFKGDHPSYSRSCNTWRLQKEIITVKIKNRLTYPEARLAVTNRTPIQGFSYAAAAKKSLQAQKKPGKNISLKIAKEEYSIFESTPVSKRFRRRKTSQTSGAMDTDANLSDTDYVIGQASEEDESLLEANFKQAMANPLTGTLLPRSPKT
ncbi:uncharacterized protein TNCV_220201 [Trichonephila clavipes]|nr:uncharacterized protein TNCV_220201 [Trichonephila clavipes]